MAMNTVDAHMFRTMFLSGAKNLEVHRDWINQLNVFPVPDGDTGTNMTLTIMAAAAEINALPEDAGIDQLCKAVSNGSLRGARGNSGVILSQLFRGFTRETREHRELDAEIISAAMERAVETAYKAVMKPKEGTILTVARAMSDRALELSEDAGDLGEFFRLIIEEGDAALARTPDQLPVLKEAGVVDSGGQGLMEVLRGAVDAFLGKEIELEFETPEAQVQIPSGRGEISTDDIKFGYCTEFIINLEKPFPEEEEQKMKDFLTSIGDSLVLVADEEIVKIHVHTNHPGLAFEKGLEYGSLCRMKIDNMRIEHQEKLFKEAEKQAALQAEEERAKKAAADAPRKPVGFISVTIGDGMSEIFKGLGVDVLIEGGQTMNPSTDDMLNAIREVHADTVFILPNNKNVILAANQAQALTEDCRVLVVPTKTVPQGITAMITYAEELSAQDNFDEMQEAIRGVKTVEVTYAVRNTKVDGNEIHIGDIMAIGDNGILAVGSDVTAVTLEALGRVTDEDSELISIYNGSDFTGEKMEALSAAVTEAFPDVDIEEAYGGQPIYYAIISVE